MRILGYLAFLWLFTEPICVGADNDCPYQKCTCDSVQILCQSANLTALVRDNNVSDATQKFLYLEANHIESIPSGSLLPNLTAVSLLDNPITTIDDDAFNESTTTLKILTFSKIRFTRIPDAMLQLKVLSYLSIYNTHIQDWNTEVMRNIGHTLRELYIGNVGLTSWPSWLQYFTQLTELSISDSSISSIPPRALDLVSGSLIKLSLINHSLTALPLALSRLYVLESLAVQGGNVADILWLPLSSKLTSLYLSNNNISGADHLSNSLRQYAYSLMYIDVQGNKLTSAPYLSFIINLREINFNDNDISFSDDGALPARISAVHFVDNSLPLIPHFFTGLKNILYLDLSHNSITELRAEDFPPTITVADFGFNHITNLTENSFPQHSNITSLILNNNPIVSISISAFRNMDGLSLLNLQYSKLIRLPLALMSLTNLTRLDMSGSSQLVCTCAEKSLQPVIINTTEVVGKCGDTDIRFFFTDLISGCS